MKLLDTTNPTHLRLILAPLRGVTDAVFRTVYARHFGGFDVALAPFVTTVKGEGMARSHVRDLLPENNPLLPVVPQVIGKDPAELVNAVNALGELGYDEVNWNLGCPFVKVTRKGRGSGLVAHPDQIVSILEYVLPRIDVVFSLKLRLGVTSPAEIEPLLPLLDRFTPGSITIHPRTADQMYGGTVRLDAFERCMALTSLPLIFNGDIRTVDTFAKLKNRFGERVNGWMIGRGAVQNPFLVPALRGEHTPTRVQQLTRLNEFHRDLFESYRSVLPGPGALLGRLKEIWGLFGMSFAGAERDIRRLCRTQSVGAYERAVERVFMRSIGRTGDSISQSSER